MELPCAQHSTRLPLLSQAAVEHAQTAPLRLSAQLHIRLGPRRVNVYSTIVYIRFRFNFEGNVFFARTPVGDLHLAR